MTGLACFPVPGKFSLTGFQMPDIQVLPTGQPRIVSQRPSCSPSQCVRVYLVKNEAHCDFRRLRALFICTHMLDLSHLHDQGTALRELSSTADGDQQA